MATVTIPDSTYQRLKDLATSMRLPLEEYLDRVAVEGIGAAGSGHPTAASGTAEWMKAFDAWVASHPARGFVADDSRDAIYGDERE
jgi:hypothetical protein